MSFICKTVEIKNKLIDIFEQYQIEHRPIVSGNLLKQPFLSNYKFGVRKSKYNVDIVHDNGLYIGNSQFVTDDHINTLNNIINKIWKINVWKLYLEISLETEWWITQL